MTHANTAALSTPSEQTSVGDDTALYFLVAISICTISLLPAVLAQLGVLPGPVDRYMVGALGRQWQYPRPSAPDC